MKKALIISIFSLTFSAAFIACTTIRPIPEDLTAPQLLQEGQACLDNSDYKNAEAIFLATIDRYGDNTETYIEAKKICKSLGFEHFILTASNEFQKYVVDDLQAGTDTGRALSTDLKIKHIVISNFALGHSYINTLKSNIEKINKVLE